MFVTSFVRNQVIDSCLQYEYLRNEIAHGVEDFLHGRFSAFCQK